MTEYHKINAPFMRDPLTKRLVDGKWCVPELEYLAGNQWQFTEKVDGTNIRLYFTATDGEIRTRFGGRTDNAQTPKPLTQALIELIHDVEDNVYDIMEGRDISELVIYGEGYGPKINGGGKYSDVPKFVAFDIKVGDFWLTRESVNDFCSKVGLDAVPVIGEGTLADAISIVRSGIQHKGMSWKRFDGDSVKNRLKSQFGDFEAEGIVAVPVVPLFDRAGRRIITKIKGVDFK